MFDEKDEKEKGLDSPLIIFLLGCICVAVKEAFSVQLYVFSFVYLSVFGIWGLCVKQGASLSMA